MILLLKLNNLEMRGGGDVRQTQEKSELYGLKGGAAICIVLYHYYLFALEGDVDKIPFFKCELWQIIWQNGFLAVELFFIISGYLTGLCYSGRIQEISFGQYVK